MKYISFLFILTLFIAGCGLSKSNILSPGSPTVATTLIIKTQNRVPTNTYKPSSTSRNTTPTISIIETVIPTTITPAPTIINQLLGKNSIAIMELGTPTVYILDLETGYIRMLILPSQYRPFQVLSWPDNGCEMIINAEGQGETPNAILRVDLQGNIVQNMLSFDHSRKIRNIAISPSSEWIAYRLSEGENLGGYDLTYEFENIEVISVDGEVGPYRLTQGNGGREVAWAPDSKRLAYSDFDENGVPQLFVSNLDGSGRIQMTQFDDPLVEINHIKWSPDGDKIAFAYDHQGNISSMEPRKTDAMIISVQTGELPTIVGKIYLINSLWWQDYNTLVVYGYKENSSVSEADKFLFWVDASTGQISDILADNTVLGGYMEIVHPMDALHKIGYFNYMSFYSYNILSHSFQSWNNVNLRNYLQANFILRDWITAPSSFQGEAACQP